VLEDCGSSAQLREVSDVVAADGNAGQPGEGRIDRRRSPGAWTICGDGGQLKDHDEDQRGEARWAPHPDPTVYERLVAILDGAQRSTILKILPSGLGEQDDKRQGKDEPSRRREEVMAPTAASTAANSAVASPKPGTCRTAGGRP